MSERQLQVGICEEVEFVGTSDTEQARSNAHGHLMLESVQMHRVSRPLHHTKLFGTEASLWCDAIGGSGDGDASCTTTIAAAPDKHTQSRLR